MTDPWPTTPAPDGFIWSSPCTTPEHRGTPILECRECRQGHWTLPPLIDEQIVRLLKRSPTLELIDFRGLLAAPTPEIEAALERLAQEGRIRVAYRLAKERGDARPMWLRGLHRLWGAE